MLAELRGRFRLVVAFHSNCYGFVIMICLLLRSAFVLFSLLINYLSERIISASDAMKPLGSSLNPYAASYIPLSKREADKNFIAENSSKKSIGGNFSGYSEHYMHNPPYDSISPNSNLRLGEKAPIAVGSAMKNHPSHGSLSQHKSEFNEMVEMFDKDFDLDLEFLKASFPGLSDQSLTDVYLANKGDVDAAIDMLSLLEVLSFNPRSFSCFYLELLFHSSFYFGYY